MITKKTLIVLFFFLTIQNSRSADLIIVIDDLIERNIRNFKIEYTEDGINKIEDYDYKVGKSVFNSILLEKFKKKQIKNISFKFDCYAYNNQEIINKNYCIEIDDVFWEKPLIIIYVYNLENRNQRKKYKIKPISDSRKYNFNIDGGDIFKGSIRK